MKNIDIKDFETENLIIKKPTMTEQKEIWEILRDEMVNKYYFPTPDRIFKKYELKNDNIEDLKTARKIFMEQLNDWNRQEPFYEKKIASIINGDNSQKYTWSIFLKNGTPIGQITVQPKKEYDDNPEIRDIGWFIKPDYQGQGLCTEAAKAVLDFMFNEVEIEKIITSSAIVNIGSWRVMEKLGFKRTGTEVSTYFDDTYTILNCYKYELDRKDYLAASHEI